MGDHICRINRREFIGGTVAATVAMATGTVLGAEYAKCKVLHQ